MATFRPARTVYAFPDGASLLHFPDDNSYTWQRPEADPRYYAEVPIIADSDTAAIREVLRLWLLEEERTIKGETNG